MNSIRNERDREQRAKFIFLSVAGVVILLLLTSFMIAGRARSGRDDALRELEQCRQENTQLARHLDRVQSETDQLRKQLAAAQARPKPAAKARTAPRTPAAAKKKPAGSR